MLRLYATILFLLIYKHTKRYIYKEHRLSSWSCSPFAIVANNNLRREKKKPHKEGFQLNTSNTPPAHLSFYAVLFQ